MICVFSVSYVCVLVEFAANASSSIYECNYKYTYSNLTTAFVLCKTVH